MPLLEELPNTDQNNKSTQKKGFETQTHQQSNQTPTNQKQSGIMNLIGQFLPLAPFVYEQFTGQKVPAMGGTMAEIQLTITQIQTNLQTLVNNQKQIYQQIEQLKNSASQQLTNLTHQFNSFKLTHTKERKEIDFNRPPENEESY